jgi:hypothetical protein
MTSNEPEVAECQAFQRQSVAPLAGAGDLPAGDVPDRDGQ